MVFKALMALEQFEYSTHDLYIQCFKETQFEKIAFHISLVKCKFLTEFMLVSLMTDV